jgi:hypothetical protein
MQIGYCDDQNLVFLQLVDESVREPVRFTPLPVCTDGLPGRRIPPDSRDGRSNLFSKLTAGSRTLSVVVPRSVSDFCAQRNSESNLYSSISPSTSSSLTASTAPHHTPRFGILPLAPKRRLPADLAYPDSQAAYSRRRPAHSRVDPGPAPGSRLSQYPCAFPPIICYADSRPARALPQPVPRKPSIILCIRLTTPICLPYNPVVRPQYHPIQQRASPKTDLLSWSLPCRTMDDRRTRRHRTV